ncbi:MAG: phosphoenolpyruvate synthase [Candidatus Thermoplasmatota archaeon]|jgi:pyruvate,water dikinase|nr:phosphoenolpyruvate synthase [Candidatus Thermoplasmatota archaeon]
MKHIYWLNELRKDDIEIGGGKAVNLGELISFGINVPEGFVITTETFNLYTIENGIDGYIKEKLSKIPENQSVIDTISNEIKERYVNGKMSEDIKAEILSSYNRLSKEFSGMFVAVRSSAITEDMVNSSFAGQQDTYLNIKGEHELIEAVKKCWASLYTSRVILYREKHRIPVSNLKIAVVVQKMVNSDSSGVMLTQNPTNGKDEVMIEGILGLGEAIVSGEVTPDNYVVSKNPLSINSKVINKQVHKIVKSENGGVKRVTLDEEKDKEKISDSDIIELTKNGIAIEKHYGKPMDIEWAIERGKIYIVQARPITAVGGGNIKMKPKEGNEAGKILIKGLSASPGKATGTVKVVHDLSELKDVKEGDILVTVMTTPDMVMAMTKAKGIVTDEGGMTCHAAIVSRELGVPCIVGTKNGTSVLKDGMVVSVDGSVGSVSLGTYESEEKTNKETSVNHGDGLSITVPVTATKVMVNIGIPEKADEYSKLPVEGVGLMRVEFILTSYVKEHPLYLIKNNKEKEFVDRLAEGISKVSRAFYPRPVIVRTSDFKTNEYRGMTGGTEFEPEESNPMIGWRGCSRYVSNMYRNAFLLELEAIKKVRNEMGLKNTWVMLPFVRNIVELEKIIEMMKSAGLERNPDFKLYLMAEVPSIIFMADLFSKYCDGFSIGSNDLTQLIMGADRDSEVLGSMGYFDERNEAIKRAISHLIKVAHEHGRVVSICGQAPSVYPEFTEFLVEEGIDSISLNPDTVIKTIRLIASSEQKMVLKSIKRNRSDVLN